MKALGRAIIFRNTEYQIFKGKYMDGNIALFLVDPGYYSGIALKISVNIPDEAWRLDRNQIFVKNYSENEGILKALIDQKIVKVIDDSFKVNYVTVPIVEILQ